MDRDHKPAPRDKIIQPKLMSERLPSRAIRDYLKAGRIFVCGEMEDPIMPEETELLGDDQLLFSSGYPHGEGWENAAQNLMGPKDLTETQKRKNPLR